MPTLQDVSTRALRALCGQIAGSGNLKPVLAINAGSAATVKTTNAIIYAIDGVLYSKAILSAQALTVKDTLQQPITGRKTFYVQPANTTVYYVLVLDSSGNVYTIQGTYSGQEWTDAATGLKHIGTGYIPDVSSDSYVPFGIIKIALGATTFTVATTALDAANVTATYYDVMHLPSSNTL